MNPIRHLRRVAGALAGLACAWLGLAVAAPAAFAIGPPPPVRPGGNIIPSPEPPGWNRHHPLPYGHWTGPVHQAPVHAAVTSGMPGWRIALIAAAAALLAAVLAVIADRARAARRRQMAGAT
jgi:hypothetical protein